MAVKKIKVGPLITNCYLIYSNNELAIIDPGDEVEKILEEIKKTKARPKYIILTHYHFDHVSAAKNLKEKTGAKILYHKKEENFLNFSADQYLTEKKEIKIGQESLKIIHTPGHTAGSICLLGKNEIFTGDTLFENGYGRTDLAGGSEEDLKDSLNKLSQILKPEMIVYPGHGEEFQYNDKRKKSKI
ncbi:MAG: MBL fold metallo-hydrolase [Patescibacteria group bacterium]|nr:MBL fold metallo-hydrolase [Patescibacteria group bacterium]